MSGHVVSAIGTAIGFALFVVAILLLFATGE